MSNQILNNLSVIIGRIESACVKCGRNPKEVRLLLATKTVPASLIEVAFEAGQTLIGENRVQEIKEKYDQLKRYDQEKGIEHTQHFIGHLQTNKIKDILKYGVSCVQSVDRLDLAEKLHNRLVFENKTLDVLIQVNTSFEESKFGIAPSEAIELVRGVAEFNTLRIKGLMTIGLFSSQEEKVRKCFKLLKQIQQDVIALNITGVEMKELSMGMSTDLETAIEEGATIVRVGTAIFGQRIHPDSYYWN